MPGSINEKITLQWNNGFGKIANKLLFYNVEMLIYASVTYTVMVMIGCFVCYNKMVSLPPIYLSLERNEPYLVVGINPLYAQCYVTVQPSY